MKNNGYKPESYHFKDYDFEKVYGNSDPTEPIIPLHRDISGVPVIFQGTTPDCVSCSATWVRSYMEATHPTLSWAWLAWLSETTVNGVNPSEVFANARNTGIAENMEGLNAYEHRIGNCFYVRLNKQAIYHALKTSVLAIGLTDWMGSGPHFVVAYDVTDDGTKLKCVNWWTEGVQALIEVPFELIDDCVAFGTLPEGATNISMPILEVLKDKFSMLSPKNKLIGGIITALVVLVGSFFGLSGHKVSYGAAGVPAEYSTELAQAIQSTDTSIPVLTNTLFTGETFNDTELFHPINIAIGLGSAREYDSCTYFETTTTYPTFIGCTRGISALATSTDVTVVPGEAQPHTAGESVSITNQPAYFNNFVDVHTNQNIGGVKTFANGQINIGSTTTEVLVTGGKAGWSDNGGVTTFTFAGGSSGLTASSTKGIFILASQIGINASSSKALAFDALGNLVVNASTTQGLKFGTAGDLEFDPSANQTFTGVLTVAAGSGSIYVPTPTNPGQAANQLYVDQSITTFQATSTAGQTITLGQPLFVNSVDSRLYLTGAGFTTSTFNFVGIASSNSATGTVVSYTRPGGIAEGLSGLNAGDYEYLANTTGTIANAPGTLYAKIGQAMTTSSMRVIDPKFIATGSFTFNNGTTSPLIIVTGFRPGMILFRGVLSASGLYAISNGDSSNSCIYIVNNGGTVTANSDSSHAVDLTTGGSTITASVSPTATGASMTLSSNTTNSVTVQYTAYSE